MNVFACITAGCFILMIILAFSLCREMYNGDAVVALDTFVEQHDFEKLVGVDQPSLFFKAPPNRAIVFDKIHVQCPSGMAAFGDSGSVTYYDSKYNIENIFYEHNGESDFYVIVPVKRILDSITCLNGSVNTSASVKVSGRYHYVLVEQN